MRRPLWIWTVRRAIMDRCSTACFDGEVAVFGEDRPPGVYGAEGVDPSSVIAEKPLFAALTLDAKIHHGDWRIIGNVTDNLNSIPQPVFKMNQETRVHLEFRDRAISRPASSSEAASLRLRTVVAPVRLENALKACNGVGQWNPQHGELRFDYALASSSALVWAEWRWSARTSRARCAAANDHLRADFGRPQN